MTDKPNSDHADELTNPMDAMLELHRENQARLAALERNVVKVVEGLATVASNTACIPRLLDRIDDLESDRDRQVGVIKGVKDSIKLVWILLLPPTGSMMAWMGSHINWSALFR